jgi:SRF-type transcription factor (DNA-binding and dimerisation domain)
LRKRKLGLSKKAYEIGVMFDIDMVVILYRKGRYFIYRSIDREAWPPSMEEIVSGDKSVVMLYSYSLESDVSKSNKPAAETYPRAN